MFHQVPLGFEPSQVTFLKGEETIDEPEPEESLEVTSCQSYSNQALQVRRSEPRPPSSLQPTTYCPQKLQAVTLRSLSTIPRLDSHLPGGSSRS
ncbi:hypothetical protein CRENBAI_001652 [Crenichthys baileyi]|uniref:Uncharacterized protein n=1 Tax=Crenichthys baileyi TaxID=28760 RepID=A0AAV9SFS3_9TELE